MAKVQLAMAATLDGFIPDENETLMQWVKTNKKGFPRWKEACIYPLFPDYPLLDLICNKDKSDNNFTYYAEITDQGSVELLRGLFLYHLVDEIVLYLIPITANKGIPVMKHISPYYWSLFKVKQYPGGICMMIYRKYKKLF